MKKKVELIIGQGVNQISLDLTENSISIALQYSIDDIRSIDKKNSNYSKTITLPGTKKNNNAFGSLFDVNSTFDEYNPNLKTPARIVVDSSPVLEGYLQLTKVNKMNNVDLQGNKISYEVVVFDDSVDFIQTLGDSVLSDLDLSSYTHILNQINVENAWNNHTYQDLYQYPLMDKITRGYDIGDFKPAIYHKGILLEIAKQAGYSLEGSFMITNENGIGPDLRYEKEIIMWDGDSPLISDTEANKREFRAGLANDVISYDQLIIALPRTLDSGLLRRNANYNEIVTLPNFDNSGTYTFDNPGSLGLYGKWTSANKGTVDFKSAVRSEVSFTGRGIPSRGGNQIQVFAYIRATLKTNLQGTVGSEIEEIDMCPVLTSYDPSLPATTVTISLDSSFKFPNIELEVGEEVFLTYEIISSPSSTNPIGGGINQISYEIDLNFGIGSPNYVTNDVLLNWDLKKVMSNGDLSYFKNNIVKDDNITADDEIFLTSYLPKEFKQKDILSDIIRRYNVYVTKHPTKDKTLILESRDDFYKDDVTLLDWTQKKDYSSEDKISFLTELQNKEILFTYKEDNSATDANGDKRNETYFGSTGDIYGQKKVSFENDFVQGIQKIESFFSSAPLIYRGTIDTKNYVVVPAVSSEQSKRNPVLCYWGGLKDVKNKDGDSEVLFIEWNSLIPAIPYSTYPYAGHWDDPYDPTIDIHYGETSYEYYGSLLNSVTDNNLYNNYWKNYIEQISNGKLVTSKFYLNETDINFIKDNLNSRIFIKDSYYVINKITDYKPLEDGLTTVELLRIEKGSTFDPEITQVDNIPFYTTFTTTDQTQTVLNDSRNGPYRSNITNNTSSNNVLMLGQRNYIGSGTTAVVNGTDNFIGSGSSGVNIQGNNNSVAGGVENVTIVGDNQEVLESNISIINGTILSLENPLSGLWERGTGTDSIVLVNSVAPNTTLGGNGSVVTGVQNSIGENSDYASIFGGAGNSINITSPVANSDGSSIVGGEGNFINGRISSIVGGANNSIDSSSTSGTSFIGGGANNSITNDFSSIIGGSTNQISGVYSSIIGGNNITGTQDNTVYVPKLVVTETYIPTGSTDTNGIVGEISYDGSFVYVKTASGWLRSTLSTF
tara:strand:+ start:7883 stop:11227 length:3345 start_codon:yes stop_codon:yes gene_type:complete